MQSVKILGARVDKTDTMGALCAIDAFITEGTFHHVITLNAEIVYRAQHEPDLMAIINQADLVTPDGAGIVWAANYLGHPVPERVTGIDLMMEVCKLAHLNGWKIFLLGGAEGVAEEAAENLISMYPNINIVGIHHGFFKPEQQAEIIEKINASEADIVFCALGAPRQEFWINSNRPNLAVKVAMGVGGSFDVISGRVKRAPHWMQKMKLEWLARLIREPWRAGRMMALPKFVLAVIKSKHEQDEKNKKDKNKKRKLP